MSRLTIIKLVKENNEVHKTKSDSGNNWKFNLPNGMPIKISKKKYNAIYGETK